MFKVGNKIQSVGINYITFLNTGRGPGKFPPPEQIKKWVIARNLKIAPYLIGRKIAQEGTEIFKDRTKGLMLEEKISITVKRISERLPLAVFAQIKERLA